MTCCIAKLLVFVLSMKQGIIGKCQFYQKSLFIRCRYQVSGYFHRSTVSNGFNLHLEVFVIEVRLTY